MATATTPRTTDDRPAAADSTLVDEITPITSCAACAPELAFASPVIPARVLELPHGRGFDERALLAGPPRRRPRLVAFLGLA